ncbi:uncharacterized protein METZ01_LOCUS393114 [marine metagenome]|uniref:Uncharacterized protein n=1 Tax=marine metagenome TaxID=408172 RepID=A0A382V1C1_9ZZZZ
MNRVTEILNEFNETCKKMSSQEL